MARSAAALVGDTPKKAAAPASAKNDSAASHVGHVDDLIHERMRLGIVSALAVNDLLTFRELKDLLQTTDGNLSVHARKLETAGYISCKKTFDNRIPKTEYKLTATGRRMFEKYLSHMEALIQAMKKRS